MVLLDAYQARVFPASDPGQCATRASVHVAPMSELPMFGVRKTCPGCTPSSVVATLPASDATPGRTPWATVADNAVPTAPEPHVATIDAGDATTTTGRRLTQTNIPSGTETGE